MNDIIRNLKAYRLGFEEGKMAATREVSKEFAVAFQELHDKSSSVLETLKKTSKKEFDELITEIDE